MRLKAGLCALAVLCMGMLEVRSLEAGAVESSLSVKMFPLTAPIKVYVESNPSGKAYSQYVIGGLRSWSQALNGRLAYTMVSRPEEAQIRVRWVPGFLDRTIAGLTTASVGQADVEIKTVGIPERDIQANIIHELGHALGIGGHSHSQQDIMTAVRRWHSGKSAATYHPALSDRDKNAIVRLYSTAWRPGEDLYAIR